MYIYTILIASKPILACKTLIAEITNYMYVQLYYGLFNDSSLLIRIINWQSTQWYSCHFYEKNCRKKISPFSVSMIQTAVIKLK